MCKNNCCNYQSEYSSCDFPCPHTKQSYHIDDDCAADHAVALVVAALNVTATALLACDIS